MKPEYEEPKKKPPQTAPKTENKGSEDSQGEDGEDFKGGGGDEKRGSQGGG